MMLAWTSFFGPAKSVFVDLKAKTAFASEIRWQRPHFQLFQNETPDSNQSPSDLRIRIP
jgi:hypothetical protein